MLGLKKIARVIKRLNDCPHQSSFIRFYPRKLINEIDFSGQVNFWVLSVFVQHKKKTNVRITCWTEIRRGLNNFCVSPRVISVTKGDIPKHVGPAYPPAPFRFAQRDVVPTLVHCSNE